ncbi:PKD domain-containing protein, partial [bacterium]|nr:PKD domain-containing protein [bacterium]
AVALRTPDKSGNDDGWPALENIITDSRTWLGLLDDIRDFGSTVTGANDTIVGALMGVVSFLEETNTFPEGLELAISYDDMNNNSPTVRVMAVVTGNDGTWANNQTLPPTNGDTNNWVSNPSVDHHANLVPGNQYITIIFPSFDTGVHFYASAGADKTLAFANTDIDFTSTVTGGTPPITYEWDLGNGYLTNADMFTYAYPDAGNYTPEAVISDNAGNSATVTIAEIKIYAPTSVDGLNITNDFAGKTNALQDTVSNWGEATVPGNGAETDQLFAYCEERHLYVGVCGNLTTGNGERTIGIFIDSDYTVGSNVMPVITSGSPAKLENLAGMTFDSDFTPDKAILLSINSPADCWVNVYHIDSNSDWYWGDKTEYTDIFDPFQRVVNERDGVASDIVAFNNLNTAANPEDANTGVECYLDMDTIYSGLTPTQNTVRIQAILFNWQTTNVANQTLPGINDESAGFGLASAVNYENVPGKQYIEVCAPIPEPGIIWIMTVLGALFSKRITLLR